MIGGRPNHALYFIGVVGNELIYLDPHICQNSIDLEQQPSSKSFRGGEGGQNSVSVSDTNYSGSNFPDLWTNLSGLRENLAAKMLPADYQQQQQQQAKNDTAGEKSDADMAAATAGEKEPLDATYHCPFLYHMPFEAVDPSLALGFFCTDKAEFQDLTLRLKNVSDDFCAVFGIL